MTNIKRVTGYKTDDGRIFDSIEEAIGHKYKNEIKNAIGPTTVFGVDTIILESACELLPILNRFVNERVNIENLERDIEAS